MAQPSVALTFRPPGPKYSISEQCVMPSITATATLHDVTIDPKAPPPRFHWNVTVVFSGNACAHSFGRTTSHSPIIGTTNLDPPTGNPPVPSMTSKFKIPFKQIRGGDLTVTVTVEVGGVKLKATSTGLTIGGSNPRLGSLQTRAPQKPAFRKLTRLESGLRQFLAPGCPLFSNDNKGGVGLCQLTSPAPTEDQIWSWKANLAGGIRLWNEKESIARGFPTKFRNSAEWTKLVKAYNDQRAATAAAAPRPPGAPPPVTPAIPVTLPEYTADQLERETLRGFNGWGGGLHEYRVKKDKNGILVVTLDAQGTKGTAEWEEVSAKDREDHYKAQKINKKNWGSTNYVEHVEGQASW